MATESSDVELVDIDLEQGGWARHRLSIGIIRRRRRVAILAALAVGLLVHTLQTYAVSRHDKFIVSFDVQYRAGSRVMAGLGTLVGALPSLLERDTIETQF
jgi:hypothetical protein